MNEAHDLEVLIASQTPLIAVESAEETQVINEIQAICCRLRKPVFKWSITEGVRRLDEDYSSQKHNATATSALQYIKSMPLTSVFVLLDFHPYLDDPVHIRLLKEIALHKGKSQRTIIFLSHEIEVPTELRPFSAQIKVSPPNKQLVQQIILEVAKEWAEKTGKKIRTNKHLLSQLTRTLSGLSRGDVRKLALGAIYDGAITECDVKEAMQQKYELINRDGVLSFEFNTAEFSEIAGLAHLKTWLEQRRAAFETDSISSKLDPPKGILLLGVQGCGKSLAAKAVSGSWGLPLLRFDFATIYNKFIGESERILSESLKGAEAMAPCVLWLDEVEKGISTGSNDGGTSRRVLGLLLTWMAEKKQPVFLVATANDISQLPPELIRKGRFDEIFFVDLPDEETRARIFAIHLSKRELKPEQFGLSLLAEQSNGFSGSEIEQAVVSARYAAHAVSAELKTEHILEELAKTRPLSVVMKEQVEHLREWARERTVEA